MIVTAALLLPCILISTVVGVIIGRRHGYRWALAGAIVGSALITNGFYLSGYL